MLKDILIYLLLILDFIILGFIVILYVKFKKVIALPWEDIEESIERAHNLVKKIQELREINMRESASVDDHLNDQVYTLAKRGLSPREIAKRLGLSEGEVEILLRKKTIP
ncbi:MAG: hypothetical protein ABDI07_07095 [Candidatus Kryptonium sp.]